MTTQTTSSNTVRSYNDILSFFHTVGYIYNRKWVPVPDQTENKVGSANFWRLWKKGAKNVEVQNEWNASFGQGNVWKHPSSGQWRFYFNIDENVRNSREEYLFPGAEAESEPEVPTIMEIETVLYEGSEQEITDKIEKSELDAQEGMKFTDEQLAVIRKL